MSARLPEFPYDEAAYADIINMGEAHLPCAILVDTSSSMSGAPIRELVEALGTLKDEILNDATARGRVEICVIGFDSEAYVAHPFSSVYDYEAPELEARGNTSMHAAVDLAINEIQIRRREYRRNGVSCYKPWIFLMSDGHPNDRDTGSFERLMNLQRDDKWNYIPVAVGPHADQGFLKRNNANGYVLVAGIDNFDGVFRFLSDSMSRMSNSQPGDTTVLANPVDYQLTVNA